MEKSEEYRFFKPWLGDGLLISSGQLLVNIMVEMSKCHSVGVRFETRHDQLAWHTLIQGFLNILGICQ